MLKRQIVVFIGLLGAAVIAPLWFSCTSIPAAPNSAKFFGYVYKQNGSPATGVKVSIVRTDYIPEKGAVKKAATNLVLVTDYQGCFGSNDITSGTYNIFAMTDSAGSFTPSVKIDSSHIRVCIAKATLHATGSIQGKIQFSPVADNRAVLVLVLGSEIAGWPYDTSGIFTLKNMPPGDYRIRILPLNPHYNIIDTAISVESGKATDIGTIISSLTDTVIIQDQYISGIWGPDKTYKIVRSVTIPQGAKLEIKEGTRIVFMGNYDFGTDGNCIAKGTVDKPILFTYSLKYSSEGWHWLGSYIVNGYDNYGDYTKTLNSDSLVFNNCIFEYCNQPCFGVQTPLPEFYFEMKSCIFRHIKNGLRVGLLGKGGLNQATLNVEKRVIIKNCIFHDINAIDSVFDSLAYRKSVNQGLWNYKQVDPPLSVYDNIFPGPCDVPSVQIVNNIFYKEQWGGEIHCYYPHNCYTSKFLGNPDDSTNVFGDPLFIDIKNGDYHFKSGSPCIGTGTDGEDMGIDFSHTTGR